MSSSISPTPRIAPSITAPLTTAPASAQASAQSPHRSRGPQASSQISGPLADLAPTSRLRGAVLERTGRRASLPTAQSPDALQAARGNSPSRAAESAAEDSPSVDAADHGAEPPASQSHAIERTTAQRLQTLARDGAAIAQRAAPHVAPALDGIAAITDLLEGVLTSPGAVEALKGTSVTSGVTWATSAIVSELSNQLGSSPRSGLVTAANLFGTLAGALSAALPLVRTNESAGIGYGSASSWGVSAGAAVASAAGVARLRDTFARVLQGGSAVANGVAAALAEAATKASAENNPSQAAALTIASGAMWLVGSLAAEGAVLRDSHISALANRLGGADDSPV
jgi:hypothetical protein